MGVTPHEVRANAKAFIDSLERLSAKQREQMPSRQFAEQFNRLLEVARETAPQVDHRLWPPPLEVTEHMGVVQVSSRYAEIETYARQVLARFPAALGARIT